VADQAKAVLSLREIVRDPALLAEKRKELDTLRLDHNKEWAQNVEFYKGNQWVFWNKYAGNGTGEVQSLGVEDGDKPRYKVRLTVDQIKPGVQQLVAQLTKTRPVIRAMPDSGSDKDVKAAQMAERLYEYWWQEFGLTSKLQTALVNAQISQGYWLITWDPLANKQFRVMLNPNDGQPITDDRMADIFREEIAEAAKNAGVDPEIILAEVEKTFYLGDIRIQPLAGTQVWLDPVPSNFEDCTYAICRYPMDVDEIEARWDKKVTPDASTSDSRPALLYSAKSDDDTKPKNARLVYVGYFRPTPSIPKGRYVVWTEGSGAEILYSKPWGEAFPEGLTALPLVKFPGIENPGSIYDDARVTMSRPLQKELNNTVSKIAMFKNLTLNPQILAPAGSLRQRVTAEPGAVVEYSMVGQQTPEWRPTPSPPGYVFEYLQDIQRRLDRVFNLMPTERSQLPPRTDSGDLVDLMQEAVADMLSPEVRRMEEALARAGTIMAEYAKEYYIEPRLLKIRGEGGSIQVEKFLNADLGGGFSFHAEAGSGLPRTRAGQTRQLKELIEMKVLSPQEAMPYLPIAGLKAIQSRMQADEEQALREIDKLIKGEPINPIAQQQAAAMAQSTGMNPQTGEMFKSPEEMMQFIDQAGLQPHPFENMVVHLSVLAQHMKGVEFERYDPEVQQRFLIHFMMTADAQRAVPQMTEPIKQTISYKATLGPTAAAKVMNQHGGIDVTPEIMSEPPLETSVYDSMDKPDQDEAGNDPMSDWEKGLMVEQQQEQADLKTAKAMSEAALADKRTAHADALHEQTVRHGEDAHAQKMTQQDEMHAERVRASRAAPQQKETSGK
jgi:hypothetical protein